MVDVNFIVEDSLLRDKLALWCEYLETFVDVLLWLLSREVLKMKIGTKNSKFELLMLV